MLQKKGKKWDGVPVPNVLVSDLKEDTFDFFRKRAAILLFHPKPENFVTGSYIKIGFFESDSELMY